MPVECKPLYTVLFTHATVRTQATQAGLYALKSLSLSLYSVFSVLILNRTFNFSLCLRTVSPCLNIPYSFKS